MRGTGTSPVRSFHRNGAESTDFFATWGQQRLVKDDAGSRSHNQEKSGIRLSAPSPEVTTPPNRTSPRHAAPADRVPSRSSDDIFTAAIDDTHSLRVSLAGRCLASWLTIPPGETD